MSSAGIVSNYNKALSRLGVTRRVGTIDEASTERRECSLWYEQTLDETLRAFAWPFATRDIALALSTETFIGYQYTYGYPADCVNILAVTDVGGLRATLDFLLSYPERAPYYPFRYPWKIVSSSDNASKLVATDLPQAYAIFTRRQTDTGSWTADFAAAFQWHLAHNIGPGLKADKKSIDRALSGYLGSVRTAGANALNERQADADPESSSIRVRG